MEDLGLGLKPGDAQYRAYVGPPGDYDLVSAMTFNLLTVLGMRQYHSVLDVGCGSLRVGRLLIPYLNRGNYTGIEPNRWLVDQGVAHEVGDSLVRIKQPTFIFSEASAGLRLGNKRFNFAVAQSIFSHCGWDLVLKWLDVISKALIPDGALVATFLPGNGPEIEQGWIYPECVRQAPDALDAAARERDLRFVQLNWRHPRQNWALFAGNEFDISWIEDAEPSWNRMMDHFTNLASSQASSTT